MKKLQRRRQRRSRRSNFLFDTYCTSRGYDDSVTDCIPTQFLPNDRWNNTYKIIQVIPNCTQTEISKRILIATQILTSTHTPALHTQRLELTGHPHSHSRQHFTVSLINKISIGDIMFNTKRSNFRFWKDKYRLYFHQTIVSIIA